MVTEFRASDADRERYAAALREAFDAGRLTMHEFDERIAAVYTARTGAELDRITQDLPTGDGTTTARLFGVLGGFSRRGAWEVPRRLSAVAFWGGGRIDLREARIEHQEVLIRCYAIMGGMRVVVPPEVGLEVRGTGFMGGFRRSARGSGNPGSPRVVVSGFAFWGGVRVRRGFARQRFR
ncbi:DUF1707 SHOCT-like domain-containing protein [Saccharopolyspora taberi]|uniref:DUF1707 domain-containing protein n=1 Tax=Saccharopolyspora taberi TaxID=60895 RepID=A0ABN3VBU8_9PSEU